MWLAEVPVGALSQTEVVSRAICDVSMIRVSKTSVLCRRHRSGIDV
jgi:hypothetical protein